MSFDLAVFAPEAAPRDRDAFIAWYFQQTEWNEGHSYDDPAITTPGLRAWFFEMIKAFPAMNGPFAAHLNEDFEEPPRESDYSIGKQMIYVGFAWSCADDAYELVRALAEKHKIGFYDVSSEDGEIVFPDD